MTKQSDLKGSSMFKMLNRTIYRYKQGSETFKSLMIRALFFPRKFMINQKDMLNEKWDYLIVLDACRYDAFEEINNIPGKLEHIYSQGTHTVEWLKNTFSNRELKDIIYISGNPQMSPYKFKEWVGIKNPFFHFENVWDHGWDPNLSTVRPEKVIDATIDLNRKYPNKRMIIHFLQPHAPFIGKEKFDMNENELKVFNTTDWTPLLSSKDTIDKIWRAYKSNLIFVLEYVEDLIRILKEGEIIITSDHGEMFGECGIYGHVPAFYSKELLKVPWLRVDRDKF